MGIILTIWKESWRKEVEVIEVKFYRTQTSLILNFAIICWSLIVRPPYRRYRAVNDNIGDLNPVKHLPYYL